MLTIGAHHNFRRLGKLGAAKIRQQSSALSVELRPGEIRSRFDKKANAALVEAINEAYKLDAALKAAFREAASA